MPQLDVHRVVGSQDRWVVNPMFTPVNIVGSGDVWIVEGRFRYPDGTVYAGVKHLELRDGQVDHETTYWAAPFPAPEWRREWVEVGPAPGDEGGVTGK